MHLGLEGKKAIICASSKGLGLGCAQALAEEGVQLIMNGRTESTLEAAANDIVKRFSANVVAVTSDITTEAGRDAVLKACDNPDILVNNAGGPPAGNFRDWGRSEWVGALDANMLTPIELMRKTIDGMADRGFGRIINITSVSVKAPIGILGLSNGARSGLTGFMAGVAREMAGQGITINNLLPGSFDTDRLNSNFETLANKEGKSVEQVRQERQKEIPTQRFGTPIEFGKACAFLCSVHAGYINGQNLLMDGGAFPGSF